MPALRDQVAAALAAARHTGWDGMLAEQRAYLDEFWEHADVHVDGDPEIQQAVRFGLFQVLQAGARAEGRAIPAKGLTGPGYDGHAFWDTESFVLPVLTYALPSAASDALKWRHSILPQARDRAKTLGLEGAAFPWRTIAGEECSAYWPAGTAAFHVTADVADAVARFQLVAGNDDFAAPVRHRPAGRDGPAVVLARLLRRRRRVPDRRRDRAGRVQRHRRQQRLHQPDGQAEPARGRARAQRAAHRPVPLGRVGRGDRRPGSAPPTTCGCPTTSG